MAVSGVSAGSAASLQNNPQNDPRLLFMQLSKAINAGDLTGAQQAYSQLTQALGNNGGGTSNSNDPFSQALNAIGQALQNGDISGAQQALSQFQQQMQAGRGRHHHGHPGGGQASDNSPSQTGSGSTTTSTQSVGATNILDVTV